MLRPDQNRLNYGELLAPPATYHLDFAIGTTYSLDLDALVGATMALGLSAETDTNLIKNPVCLLEALKKSGKKVYLLSNAQRIFTEYEMNYLDITKYFDDIFISSDYGTKKPDIRFFEQLIEKYHLDVKKTLMIGNDVRCDINGAKEAGLDTFYIHSNISPKDDKKPDSTYYLPAMDMKKVKELILQNASGTHGA